MPPRVKKPTDIRELATVEVSRLIALASRISPETWGQEDRHKENDFAVFHHTQHLVFRFISENRDPEDFYANPAWDVWKPVLMPLMQQAIAPYGFRNPQFPKAMLAKLAAGHQIDPHYDGAGSNQRVHKIHIPLVTNPEAEFLVGDGRFHLDVGKAYEVNNIISHGAVNQGSEDRIHFIFEVFEGDYQQTTVTPDGGTAANADL